MVRWFRSLTLTLALSTLAACSSHVQPNLSPQAVAAWHGTQAIRTLDLLRDAAIAANETIPPLIPENDTRKVVLWHESAIKTVHDVPRGWEPAIRTGLIELQKALPPDIRDLLAPYITLGLSIAEEVRR